MEESNEIPKQMNIDPKEMERLRQQQQAPARYFLIEFTTEEGTVEKVGIVAKTIFEALFKFARKFSEIDCEELSIDVTLIDILR